MKRIKFLRQSVELYKANKSFLAYICRYHWPLLILQMGAILLSGISAALVSQTSKLFIESIIVEGNLSVAMGYIIFWMCFMFVMKVTQYIVTTYSNYAYSKAQIKVKENISKKIANLKLSYYDVPANRDSLSRASNYAESGGPQLLNYFFSLLTNFVAIVAILYVLTPFAKWIALFLVLLTIYKAVIETFISKKNYEFHKEKTLLNRRISYFSGIFSNSNTILDLNIFNCFDFFFMKYRKIQQENISLNRKHSIKINFLSILSLLAVITQNIVLYLYIGRELLDGRVSVADFTLFFTAVNFFTTILTSLRKSFSQFVPMALEAQNYTEFLNTSEDQKYVVSDSHNLTQINHVETIEFQNVSFKYPGKEEYILKDISFTIANGEIVSLVGMNGAGKTSIIKLMLGLYSVTDGKILINSIPIENIDIRSYWSCCGTMFQQPNIYAITAYENITFDETGSYNIDEILQRVELKDLFNIQPKGTNTELSRSFDPHGIMLSGGENQKIAFSRLCFHNRNMLILDEPSSALDAKAENDLFEIIDETHEKNSRQIILFVSHRLSSSTRADKILFIKNGEIPYIGNHSYMMNHCSDYKELFMMQAKNYAKNDV